jgi:hypothetical protein
MIIKEKQLQLMLQVLVDSLDIIDHFKVDRQTRKDLVNQIFNQQSNKLKDVSDDNI